MGNVACSLPFENPTPCALHLDHGDSLKQVKACMDAGYTSVMLDFSARTFNENNAALKEVVRIAHPLGITVEGELGSVGKVSDSTSEGGVVSTLTDPNEAYNYVLATGIDALAVSIGNAHGHYTKLPKLRFDILGEVYSKVKIPIVLHGGSGTPDEDIKKAVSLGVAKVNIASELNSAFRNSLKTQWNSGLNPWSPLAMHEALKQIASVVEKWIHISGSQGKA
jgi:fructose-bisphosphate aldolase class II